MAEAKSATPRGDFLARLTTLAAVGTASENDHTGLPVATLRPRLPSRFEAPSATVPETTWSELEVEHSEEEPPRSSILEPRAPMRRLDPALPAVEPVAAPPRPVTTGSEGTEAPAVTPIVVPPAPVAEPRPAGEASGPRRIPAEPPLVSEPKPRLLAAEPGLPRRVSTPRRAEAIPEPMRLRSGPDAPPLESPAFQELTVSDTTEQPTHDSPGSLPTLRPASSPQRAARDEPLPVATGRRVTGEGAEFGPAPLRERRAAPPPPIINVTIGRIEVRAPVAAPPSPAPRSEAARPEPPRPAVSLETYLERRADGRY